MQSLGGHKNARISQLFDLCRELRTWIHLLLEMLSLAPGWLISKLNLPQEIGKFWNYVLGLSDLKWLPIMWWSFPKTWIWLVCGLQRRDKLFDWWNVWPKIEVVMIKAYINGLLCILVVKWSFRWFPKKMHSLCFRSVNDDYTKEPYECGPQ